MEQQLKSTVLIVEPNSTGHRLWHVALLLEDCHLRGVKAVVLTTEKTVESPQWQVHVSKFSPESILRPLDWFKIPNIARESIHFSADVTILLDADSYLLPVLRRGWKGRGKLAVLMMRGEVQPGPPLAGFRPVKTLAKRALIWVAGFRPHVRVFVLVSPLVPRRGPLHWVADPVVLRSNRKEILAIRRFLNSDGDRYWLGVFGEINARKNLPLLLEAIQAQPNVGLLIAGSVDPEVAYAAKTLLSDFVANGGRVIHLDGPLTDEKFDSAIAAVDCVVAAYSTEASSGVVLKAAASGKRLILAGAKCLRNDARQLGSQATWTTLDVHELRRAVEQAQHLPAPAAGVPLSADEFVRALTGK